MPIEHLDVDAYKYLAVIAMYSTIALALIVFGVTVVMGLAFYKSPTGSAFWLVTLIERAGTLQMITVIVIVMGACILAAVGRISAEGIVSILSGIAGYVLGNSTRPGNLPMKKPADPLRDEEPR